MFKYNAMAVDDLVLVVQSIPAFKHPVGEFDASVFGEFDASVFGEFDASYDVFGVKISIFFFFIIIHLWVLFIPIPLN